jgi:hypothetical protein
MLACMWWRRKVPRSDEQTDRLLRDVQQGALLARGVRGDRHPARDRLFGGGRRSGPFDAGNSPQNSVPTPHVLATPICPPINSTSCLVTTRPMPVPSSVPFSWPRRLKGWNSWPICSSERPAPVSFTYMRTCCSSCSMQRTVTECTTPSWAPSQGCAISSGASGSGRTGRATRSADAGTCELRGMGYWL